MYTPLSLYRIWSDDQTIPLRASERPGVKSKRHTRSETASSEPKVSRGTAEDGQKTFWRYEKKQRPGMSTRIILGEK